MEFFILVGFVGLSVLFNLFKEVLDEPAVNPHLLTIKCLLNH
jgi:hypothetical protein